MAQRLSFIASTPMPVAGNPVDCFVGPTVSPPQPTTLPYTQCVYTPTPPASMPPLCRPTAAGPPAALLWLCLRPNSAPGTPPCFSPPLSPTEASPGHGHLRSPPPRPFRRPESLPPYAVPPSPEVHALRLQRTPQSPGMTSPTGGPLSPDGAGARRPSPPSPPPGSSTPPGRPADQQPQLVIRPDRSGAHQLTTLKFPSPTPRHLSTVPPLAFPVPQTPRKAGQSPAMSPLQLSWESPATPGAAPSPIGRPVNGGWSSPCTAEVPPLTRPLPGLCRRRLFCDSPAPSPNVEPSVADGDVDSFFRSWHSPRNSELPGAAAEGDDGFNAALDLLVSSFSDLPSTLSEPDEDAVDGSDAASFNPDDLLIV
eukprot:EG_transcript_10461